MMTASRYRIFGWVFFGLIVVSHHLDWGWSDAKSAGAFIVAVIAFVAADILDRLEGER